MRASSPTSSGPAWWRSARNGRGSSVTSCCPGRPLLRRPPEPRLPRATRDWWPWHTASARSTRRRSIDCAANGWSSGHPPCSSSCISSPATGPGDPGGGLASLGAGRRGSVACAASTNPPGGFMDVRLVFGISVLMFFVSSGVVARLYLWPRLRNMPQERALVLLVAPHMFLRFIGLSFLVPGVVSPSLPAAFAAPAAYGDLVAGVLAIVSTVGLARRASWAVPLVWVFNVWGAADLLFAFYQGPRLAIGPGAFGAAFFIPTAVAPVLLVTHFLIFCLLLRPASTSGRG